MRTFVVKFTDSRKKQWLEDVCQEEILVKGMNMPQAIRNFYGSYGHFSNEIKIQEIYEVSGSVGGQP